MIHTFSNSDLTTLTTEVNTFISGNRNCTILGFTFGSGVFAVLILVIE